MASKKEFLSYLSFLIGSGTISKKDLESAYFKATGDDFIDQKIPNRNNFIEKVEKNILLGLSIFGGLILFFVVFLFLNSYWNFYDPFLKIIITLGMGTLLFSAGILGYRLKFLVRIPNSAILLSSILLPLGLQVLVTEFFPFLYSENLDQVIYFVLGIFYLSFYQFFKKNTLLLISIINFSWAYLLMVQYSLFNWLDPTWANLLKVEGVLMVGFITLGIVYLTLASSFQKTIRKNVNNYLIPASSVLIYMSLFLSFYVFEDFYYYLVFFYGLCFLLGYYLSFRFIDLWLLLLNFIFSIFQIYLLLVEGQLTNFNEYYLGSRVLNFWLALALSFVCFVVVFLGIKNRRKSLL